MNLLKTILITTKKPSIEDNSWPVVYHLSQAKNNVINWYKFKKDSEPLNLKGKIDALTSALYYRIKHVTSVKLPTKEKLQF